MTKHEEWQPVLDKEIERLSALAWYELVGLTDDERNYDVSLNEKKYQVEVELLEIEDTYVTVVVAVDDSPTPFPSPVRSLCGSFRKEKD
jgi:hypothetical protein